MSVYVDEPTTYVTKLRWKTWSHMTADSDDELHAMATKLGLQRAWFQYYGEPDHPKNHYDVLPTKRKLALKFGAIGESGRERARRLKQEGKL